MWCRDFMRKLLRPKPVKAQLIDPSPMAGDAPPWHRFFPQDFVAEVYAMSLAEIGAYAILRAAYWREGPIPLEHLRRYRVSRRVWERIQHLFRVEDGRIVHPGLEEERQRVNATAGARSAAARHAADARWHPDDAQRMPDALRGACATDAQRMPEAMPEACVGDAISDVREEDPDTDGKIPDTDGKTQTSSSDFFAKKRPTTTTIDDEGGCGGEYLRGVRELMWAYVRDHGWSEPDDDIIRRTAAAANGASLDDLQEFFRGLYTHEQSPRHPRGPKSYAWFPVVVANHFGGGG